ncbi:MAG: hypothetical protein EAY75_02095 [Bacteroidetes bacterium]|nr:MAG: hypothetical protein EAY75_02095 [Bacteroidota bacterium]
MIALNGGATAVTFACLNKIALKLRYQSKEWPRAGKLPIKRKSTKAERGPTYLLSLFNFKAWL